MLPVPPELEADPDFAPMLALCEDVLLTPEEVARHLRYSIGYLSNLRRAKRGPAFIKLTGAIRYRMSAVLSHELRGESGVTQDRIALALATVPGLTPALRATIEVHLEEQLFPRKIIPNGRRA